MPPRVGANDVIPRAHLFGNPVRAAYKISPDGIRLAWLAPVEGVLNVWVGPVHDPGSGEPVTRAQRRGVTRYGWTYDARYLVYLQDAGGDEDYHLYAVDLETGEQRDLTPMSGVQARLARVSRVIREGVLVALNDRDRRFHDLYSIDLATGTRELVQENPGFAGFIVDDRYQVQLARRIHSDGSSELLRQEGAAWRSWLTFPAEDAQVSGASRLDARGTALFCRDSRGRDTAALTRIDLASGATTVLAAHDEADIGAALHDIETYEPVAYRVNHTRWRWYVLDKRLGDDFAFLGAHDLGDWHLAARTEDDRLWLVVGDTDTHSGVSALYDRRAKALRVLGSARPDLDAAPLAPTRSIVVRSRDGLDLVSYLTRPREANGPGPLVLLVHGGPWRRVSFGFSPVRQWLANRGYAVAM